MNTTLDGVVARNVHRLRLASGLSQEGLAELLSASDYKFDRQIIAKIERGQRGVRLEELMALAAVFSVPHTELLEMAICPECRGTGVISRPGVTS